MSEYEFVLSTGEKVPVIIETRRGMRNITLRPQTTPKREIHISKPWMTPSSAALDFLNQKRQWCDKIFLSAPNKKRLHPGDIIELFGHRVLLQQDTARRANKFIPNDKTEQAVLIVGGATDMFEPRVRNFIKSQFLIETKKIIKTTPREFWPAHVAVRDTSSRWGSCSSSGTMSFSWRLAFAPTEIMRYVIIHELAHKKYLDHSAQFWNQVAKLYGFGVERAKLWLSKNGANLHKYF